MAIIRNSSTYNTGSSLSSTYTIAAYDPSYPADAKGRIIFVSFRSVQTQPGNSAVVSATYGGVDMKLASGHAINNFVTSIGIWYIINPPTGAQDIIFTSINSNGFGILVGVVAYHSDTDFSFRLGKQNLDGISGSAVSAYTTNAADIIDGSVSFSGTTTKKMHSADVQQLGRTFYNTNVAKLGAMRMMVTPVGSPTGTAKVKIYAITGTPGTNAQPTGAALATSESIDVSNLIASAVDQYTEFHFTGADQITLSPNTYYFWLLDANSITGDASNYLRKALRTGTAPDPGNGVSSTDSTNYTVNSENYNFAATVVGISSTGNWCLGLTTAAVNQTLTLGTYVIGDANPGKFMVVDSNGDIVPDNATGVGVTIGTPGTILQEVVTFLPIRKGYFLFFFNL